MKEFPSQVTNQQSLVRLDVSASILTKLHENDFGDLSKIEVLELGGDRLLEWLPLLHFLKSLKELWLFDCQELKFFPNSLGFLT